MAVIEKYPSIFFVGGGNRAPPFVRLTEKAERIVREEAKAKELMEPILVRNIKKLLMFSIDYQVPLGKIKLIESELGLPDDLLCVLTLWVGCGPKAGFPDLKKKLMDFQIQQVMG
ncbi:Plant organelle RNA recognition domain containing protein [Trema orientale]|uniref:Plant organelle RNA recognition domain containing protein n=1 Tax=Trema orientale TaxID=63057 RepID=A0A2P5AG17_TREOI|nr:Plant organelle RNA recognition domain containing protein [Trema orientale]